MSFDRAKFEKDKIEFAEAQYGDAELRQKANDFLVHSYKHNYGYQWTWLDLPIIQMPQDIVITQELIWKNRPTVIIETGVAWGGSIVLYASLMQLYGEGRVVGIDLNLHDHVSDQIMSYPFSDRISLIKGSSTDESIVESIRSSITPEDRVMVILDSNHSHQHVLDELRIYAPMVTQGQHMIVSDTIVETIPSHDERPREWGKGNNPATAVWAYLEESDRFEVDEMVDKRLLMGFTPGGYLRCVGA